MIQLDCPNPVIPMPLFSEPSYSPMAVIETKTLALDSTLGDLSLYQVEVEAHQLVMDVAKLFDQNPLFPGVVLMANSEFVGMISRRRFLERMSRPYALELFLKRPVRSLYEFTQVPCDIFSETTLIVEAARRSLERSPELLYEPILVHAEERGAYYLVDVHQLLLAQSRIHQITSQLLDQSSYAERMQTEKMVSLGRMVAGVAHEIKNPVNSINGNVEFLTDYYTNLLELITYFEEEVKNPSEKIQDLKDEIDLEFILEDAPKILKSIQLGSERLVHIVTSLRNFSRIDDQKKQLINVHECVDGTLLILENKTKHEIVIRKDYDNLPEIACYSGQLSQVFMNLLANAIDALMEKKEQNSDPHWQPEIKIVSRYLEQYQNGQGISIKIIDNGPGIPPENQQKIFNDFFTTKPVGKGTGLGLAISYQVVVEKHQGELKLVSTVGEGTAFEVLLPF